MDNFADWFVGITGNYPYPYQSRFAEDTELPDILKVPTGTGKTATIILGWWYRRKKFPQTTPRRLVFCLPMRTLVQQTYNVAKKWFEKVEEKPEIHLLMGGAIRTDWYGKPDVDCILIGTQDQLLSRALNRGYGVSRNIWSMHFALLNNDCLWVMDEVQLMRAGLQTSAQLQGFREYFGTYAPVKSIWMSATLDEDLLQTVDHQLENPQILQLEDRDLVHPVLQSRVNANKQLKKAETVLRGKNEEYAKVLAKEVVKVHQDGTLTIVICNQVERAQAVYQAIDKIKPLDTKLNLIHSRFRFSERENFHRNLATFTGILVATQAIEAGVDISAKNLFTEIAPWSSLVQRFGRCNRYGEYAANNSNDAAVVYWIDIDLRKKNISSPYEVIDLEAVRDVLETEKLTNVAANALAAFFINYPEYSYLHKFKWDGLIPRKQDLIQLFDTSVDLAGDDIDISSFIRESNDTDVAIAWRKWDLEGDKSPHNYEGFGAVSALHRDELCRVSIYRFKELFKNLKYGAWTWERLDGKWRQLRETKDIYPGLSILLHCLDGGYTQDLGFTGNPKHIPGEINIDINSRVKQEEEHSDLRSQIGKYIALKEHSEHVANHVKNLCDRLKVKTADINYNLPIDLMVKAGRWHDLGKAHPVFQSMLIGQNQAVDQNKLWAKSDGQQQGQITQERRGFRHELVSALVALQQNEEFLLAYLVAAHHGKVRMTIQPRPQEKAPDNGAIRYALGVWEGDEIPDQKQIENIDLGDGIIITPQVISLECMELGVDTQGNKSWMQQAMELLDEYGAFKLAFLETIIRVADWSASAEEVGKKDNLLDID